MNILKTIELHILHKWLCGMWVKFQKIKKELSALGKKKASGHLFLKGAMCTY